VAWLSRATGRMDAVLAALAVARLIEVVPWLMLLVYGVVWGLPDRYPLIGTSGATFAVLFSAGLLAAMALARAGDRLAARLPFGRAPALRVAEALRALAGAPRAVCIASLLVVPTAAFNVLSVWLVLRGYGVPMPLSEAAAVVPAADTVISLPVTVAGLGLREGVFVTFLEPWGVSESRAVAAAFTRWTGELARAAVGGVLFVASGRLRAPPPTAAAGGGEER
ncbi:MAG: lysylphosphatidylglycerol synthase domain-containing protein, partial [Myxococcota bacterium]|nr:lysylphosphatidylglycerol synthase domain-containing protein [Myxococcota bacterium]